MQYQNGGAFTRMQLPYSVCGMDKEELNVRNQNMIVTQSTQGFMQ